MSSLKHATQAFLVLLVLLSALTVVQIGAQSTFDLDRIAPLSLSVETMPASVIGSVVNQLNPHLVIKPAGVAADGFDQDLDVSLIVQHLYSATQPHADNCKKPTQTHDQNYVQLVASATSLIDETATATTFANLVPRLPTATLTVLSTQYLPNSAHADSNPESTDVASTSSSEQALATDTPDAITISTNPTFSLEPNPFLTFVSSSTDGSTITSYPSTTITSSIAPSSTGPMITDSDSDPNTTAYPDDPDDSTSTSITSSISLSNSTESSSLITIASETMITSISTHVSYVTASASSSISDTESETASHTSTVIIHPSPSASSAISSVSMSRSHQHFAIVAIGFIVIMAIL